MRNGVAFCPENRRTEGLVEELTVRENIILALQAARGWTRPIPRKRQDELVEHWIKALDIRTAGRRAAGRTLSGGNQQKVLLARWLITEPKLLILDEPTRGIDVGAKTEIQRLVVSLCDDGMSVLFISAEIEEVLRLSHKVAVLRDRQIVAELANDGTSRSTVGADDRGRGSRMTEASPVLAVALDRRAAAHQPLRLARVLLDPDEGRAPVRQPDRHPQLRRAADARRARHDARDRHRRHRPLGRRRRGDLRRLRLPADQPRARTRTASARCSSPSPPPSGSRCCCGLWNGVLVAVIGIQPIIATLILMVAGRGIAQLITSGQIITINSSPYKMIGAGYLFAAPLLDLHRGRCLRRHGAV